MARAAVGRLATTTNQKRKSVIVANTENIREWARADLHVGEGYVNMLHGHGAVWGVGARRCVRDCRKDKRCLDDL